MEAVVHVGIDLAWGSNGRSGVAAVDDHGALIASTTVKTDDEIEDFAAEHAPRIGVVAIDAPLIVVNADKNRPCERAINAAFSRFDAGAYPANTSNPYFDTPRGSTVAARLGVAIDPDAPRRERVAIEVYPHPAMIGLFRLGRTLKYKRKRQGFAVQHAETLLLLEHMEGIEPLRLVGHDRWRYIRDAVDAAATPGALGRVEDEIDGILCAHLAWLWAQRSDELMVYGNVETGFIVAPHEPTLDPTPRAPRPPSPAVLSVEQPPAPVATQATTPSPPHLFVLRGDITQLECDAWMLPSDRSGRLASGWLSEHVTQQRAHDSLTDDFVAERTLATPLLGASDGTPAPILVAVPFHGVRGIDDDEAFAHIDRAVREFVALGARIAHERASERPLVAMPAFATREGGGGAVRGRILRTLIDAAQDAAVEHGADVVLVLHGAAVFAQAQVIRRRSDVWPTLVEQHSGRLEALAGHAKRGRLVPFMGSGVSAGAGAPSWDGLIAGLAADAGMTEAEQAALADHGNLDKAAILESFFARREGGEGFRDAVVRLVTTERYGLVAALLANLGAQQAITLNYDDLYERATKDAFDREVTVIAARMPAKSTEHWLLKLHGTREDPASIVLTRDDYLGFQSTRNALSSIVKANLLTHHLLFVGFGFGDDHFHEIVHDVRRALPDGAPLAATAVHLKDDPLLAAAGGRGMDVVAMGEQDAETSTAARELAIFLDALVAFATDGHEYLMDEDFDHVLHDSDVLLRDGLRTFADDLPAAARDSDAWPRVEQMLRDLGWKG